MKLLRLDLAEVEQLEVYIIHSGVSLRRALDVEHFGRQGRGDERERTVEREKSWKGIDGDILLFEDVRTRGGDEE